MITHNQRVPYAVCLAAVIGISVWPLNGKMDTWKPIPDSVKASMVAVDEIVIDEMAKHNYIGCSVAVVQGNKIIHLKGYGHLDERRTDPVTSSTVFRWGSISKVLTAVATWKLIEHGKLSLTAKVANKVNYWPRDGKKDDITVTHLLNHRSGINHYTNYDQNKYKSDKAFNAEQCVDVFKDAPLLFTPGSSFTYSTFGYNLLGAVVEVASDRGYVEYIKNNIREPLEMSSLKELSDGHPGYGMSCNGGLQRQEEADVLWKLPGGGWASNVEDLAKFMMGLMNNSLLVNTSEMWQAVPNNSNYCYGLQNVKVGNESRISHGGANDEIRTEMAFYPNSGLGVVVMIDGDNYCSAKNLAMRIEKYFGKPVKPEEMGARTNVCNTVSCTPANSVDRLVAVWNYDEGETVWRRRLGDDQFHAEWDWLDKVAGYDLIDVETYKIDDARYWDGLFKKQQKGTALWRNLTTDAFHDKWEEMNKDGYRLLDIETYEDNKTRYWAGVFEKASDGYALYRNYKTNDFNNKVDEENTKGLRLVDVEVYKADNGELMWNGVWRAGTATHFVHGKTIDQFVLTNKSENAAGYRLIDVETYLVNGERRWAGIFEPTSGSSSIFQYDKTFCSLASSDSIFINRKATLTDLEIYK